MQHRAYNATIATTANAAAIIANTYIVMMFINSKILIIKYDNIYNAAPANMRSRDTINIYNFAATPATAIATCQDIVISSMLVKD